MVSFDLIGVQKNSGFWGNFNRYYKIRNEGNARTPHSRRNTLGETYLHNFLFQHELEIVNKKPTYFKNAHNPSCIDFISTTSQEVVSRWRLYLLDYLIFINWSCLYLKQYFQSQNLRRLCTEILRN